MANTGSSKYYLAVHSDCNFEAFQNFHNSHFKRRCSLQILILARLFIFCFLLVPSPTKQIFLDSNSMHKLGRVDCTSANTGRKYRFYGAQLDRSFRLRRNYRPRFRKRAGRRKQFVANCWAIALHVKRSNIAPGRYRAWHLCSRRSSSYNLTRGI